MTLYLISNISARNVTLCSGQHAAHGPRFEFPWSAVHLTDMKVIYVTLITSRFFFFFYISSGLRHNFFNRLVYCLYAGVCCLQLQRSCKSLDYATYGGTKLLRFVVNQMQICTAFCAGTLIFTSRAE
jgi:hypothetical protein